MPELNASLVSPVAGRKVFLSVLPQQMTTDEARAFAQQIEAAANQSDSVSPIITAATIPTARPT